MPQRRHRLVMVARKGEEPPPSFPPAPTHAIHVSAGGEALRGCEEGRVITGTILEKVRMRAGMTREQVGAMGYRPRNAYCVMDMSEPAWTLTSSFTNASGGRYVVEGESGDCYICLSIKEGAALQSFNGAYNFRGTKSAARMMVANAVPPRLAEAVAGGLTPPMPPV